MVLFGTLYTRNRKKIRIRSKILAFYCSVSASVMRLPSRCVAFYLVQSINLHLKRDKLKQAKLLLNYDWTTILDGLIFPVVIGTVSYTNCLVILKAILCLSQILY
jgi:hypothetical protein